MTLPTSRSLNATPAADIPSNLINEIQDNIIGVKKPSMTRNSLLTPSGVSIYQDLPASYCVQSSANGSAIFPIPTEVGDRVTGFALKAYGNGVVDVNFYVWIISDAMLAAILLGTLVDVNRAAAWGTVTIPAFVAHVMAANECLCLQADPNAAGSRLGRGTLIYDRL